MAGQQPQIKVEGARELRRTMKAAGKDLGDLKAVHGQIGGLVVSRAQAAAPKVSGALAGTVKANSAATNVTIKFGSASVPYGGPIHWGWPARNIASNPFVADAAKQSEPEWTRLYLVAVDQILDKVKGD